MKISEGKKVKSMVRVFAPATVANVGCGYDVFGFAVENPGDEVVVHRSSKPGIRIVTIEGDGGLLSKDVEKNTAGVAAREVLKLMESHNLIVASDVGIEIELIKKMPLGSGMGSSAASSVAAAVAVNELFGAPLTRMELLPCVMEGERIACGAAHADNVAPSLLGGFVLIRSYNPLDVISIQVPDELYAVIVHPHVEVRTADARRVLPQMVALKDAAQGWGNTAGLIAGLLQKDYALIGRSLSDRIVEPVRSALIPHFGEVKALALAGGALGCSISGSGPSIFALCKGEKAAQAVSCAMAQIFEMNGIGSDQFVSRVNPHGAQLISSNQESL